MVYSLDVLEEYRFTGHEELASSAVEAGSLGFHSVYPNLLRTPDKIPVYGQQIIYPSDMSTTSTQSKNWTNKCGANFNDPPYRTTCQRKEHGTRSLLQFPLISVSMVFM